MAIWEWNSISLLLWCPPPTVSEIKSSNRALKGKTYWIKVAQKKSPKEKMAQWRGDLSIWGSTEWKKASRLGCFWRFFSFLNNNRSQELCNWKSEREREQNKQYEKLNLFLFISSLLRARRFHSYMCGLRFNEPPNNAAITERQKSTVIMWPKPSQQPTEWDMKNHIILIIIVVYTTSPNAISFAWNAILLLSDFACFFPSFK